MREIVHGTVALGTVLGILVTFALVLCYGAVAIIEPRRWVLVVEMVALVLVLVLDVERLRDDLRRLRGPK